MQNISSAMRFFTLMIGSIMALGIWLTGVNTVHWLLYLPPAFLFFAAITGICPGMMFSEAIFATGKSSSKKGRRKR